MIGWTDEERRAMAAAIEREYRIGEPVRSGPNSTVFSATRVADMRPVALKFTRFSRPMVPHAFEDYVARHRECAAIAHPNIMKIEAVIPFPQADTVAVASELVRGTTLRELLFECAHMITVGALIDLLRQAAAGVDTLHRAGIIHRDIKPDNFLVEEPGRIVKLGDFGAVVRAADLQTSAPADCYGTPAYVAPEQIIGTSFGPAVDIYAFAMAAYVLLTRSLAFDAATLSDLTLAHIHQQPIPLRKRNRAWPAAVEAAVMRSLSKQPWERHARAAELVEQLATALGAYTPLRLSSYFDGSFSSSQSGEFRVAF